MPSPACTVQDGAGAPQVTTNGVNVTPGNVITIQLLDLGVDSWSCQLVGQDDQITPPTVTTDIINKKATFTAPAGAWTLIFRSQVNQGVDINGNDVDSYTTTLEICALATGNLRLFATNERAESSAAFGWIPKINAVIRLAAAALGGFLTLETMSGADKTLSDTTNTLVRCTTCNGHILTLPAGVVGQQILVTIEDTSLTSGDLTIAGGGHNIEATIAGTPTTAATYAVKESIWGDAPSISLVFNGSFWKVS